MSIVSKVKSAFKDRKIPNYEGYYGLIDSWKQIYKSCPPWRKVKKGGLYAKGDRNMSLMNVAKVLADEFSNLTFSEQVEITTSVPEYQEYLNRVLQENGFWKNIPDFLSLSYGLGGGILKVYAENGKPRIDYIGGDMFVPTAWNSRGIFEGVFSSITYRNGYYYTLFEWHSFNSNGEASVENILYKSLLKSSLGSPCPLDELFPDLVQSASYNGVNVPMFSYFKPCVSNNADIDCPLGISVFANSLDTLKALDIAFDSFTREFILGKKRIIVPSSCIRTVVDAESGAMKRYFDADDEAFIALKSDETQDLKITDNTVELRVEEHISAINALLNILCFQTGLSAGSLSFDSTQGMKTATEVISQNSKTARTMKGHKNLAKELFENLANSVISLGISLGDIPSGQAYAITVAFNDNIIIDDNTLIENNVKLVGAQLKSKLKAIMEVQKCDEETAKKEMAQIAKEQQITSADIDSFGDEEA